ncbi:DUF945 family protein [Vibrio penaeicida]|uniref:DUF945 family protein n=1 Tax=Vibrio penaeicida TaxID=104609 RepID=UPI00273533AD|nr:DUF945 family protein [Vibrio penaeicida]MDP2571317.1 DUF945 family protein [Vibrio penaeicida]
MHSLKKMGAIGGAILLVACWPLAVGQIAQKVIEDGVQNLNSSSVKAEIAEYDRGYFSATAITRYTITDPQLVKSLEADGLPASIEVVHDISHGLVGIDAHSYVKDSLLIQFELATQTKLNGDTHFELVGRKFNFTDSKGAELIVGQYAAQGVASVAGALEATVTVPKASVNFSNGDNLVLNSFIGEGAGQREGDLWVGQQNISVKGFQLSSASGENDFQLEDLQYVLKTNKDESGEKFDSVQTLSIKSASTGENHARDLELDFAFNGINSQALEQLISIYGTGENLTEERMNESMPLLDQLVETGFGVQLNKFALNLDGGDFQSAWQLTVPSGQKNVSQNASVLLNVVEGNLDAFISNELLQSYPFVRENIDELLIMEFASEDAKGVGLNAKLINGQVTFSSGKQIPLLALFMPLMAGGK